jgi:hypothetical protein
MAVGPDFSMIDSKAKAEALLQRGELERLFLVPSTFGGRDVPENVLLVPVGIVAIKAGIDADVIAPLVSAGKVSRYRAIPEYQGDSFIPAAIVITASDPEHFETTINVWGDRLAGPAADPGSTTPPRTG